MKDPKGHGSNTRGGKYPNIEKSGFRKGQHVGYSDGAWRITGLGGGRYQAVHQQSGNMIFGDSLGHISSQLTDRDNERAAASLHSGTPKSDVAPVHDSMTNQNADVWHGGPYTTVAGVPSSTDRAGGDAGRKNTSAKYPGGRYIKDV